MEAFDYLSVLVSIVLGLGITQVLSGFGTWLTERDSVRLYPPAVIWAFSLLLIHVQTWWSMHGLRYWHDWNFLQFSLVLAQPIVLYLLSVLVLPSTGRTDPDLRKNYLKNQPWFFGFFLLLLLISLVKDLARQGALPEVANLAFHGLLFVAGALAAFSRKDSLNLGLALAVLILLIAYIVLLFAELA